ncbi:hypothetical protein RJT34_23479 [Clitoria ternatea]|uniref:Uncharacterized protein n=1 Tax=Clitoria ternatea TaxID=43366 RepID=A0AAN9FLQ5_CLITE
MTSLDLIDSGMTRWGSTVGHVRKLVVGKLMNCCKLYELAPMCGLPCLYEHAQASCISSFMPFPVRMGHLRASKTLSFESDTGSPSTRVSTKTFAFAFDVREKDKFVSFKSCKILDYMMEERLQLDREISSFLLKNNFVSVCIPGSRVPTQFKCKTPESPLTIKLPFSQFNFLGLIFYAVLSPSMGMKPENAQICCQFNLPNGKKLGQPTRWYGKSFEGNEIEMNELYSNHLYMWFDSDHFDTVLEIYRTKERQVSFQFYVTIDDGEILDLNNCFQECGVYVIRGLDLEESEPFTRSSDCCVVV